MLASDRLSHTAAAAVRALPASTLPVTVAGGAGTALAQLRPVHCSAHASAAAGGQDGTGDRKEPSQPPAQAEAATAAEPVRNPMQAALAAALAEQRDAAAAVGASQGQELGGLAAASRAAAAPAVGGRRRQRTWMWYDESDEREERRKERRRLQYGDAGTAHMMDVPQSMKKMDRIVRLVRGLPYSEALAQCRLVPHKAAVFLMQALERAYKDATEEKGLNGDKLVVSTIFVTKGAYIKGMQPMGRGASGRKVARKSHLRVMLTESRRARPSFSARVVPPLMAAWAGTTAARWLAAAGRGRQGGPGAAAAAPRQRFAYRVEV